jgi:hypothetical protein
LIAVHDGSIAKLSETVSTPAERDAVGANAADVLRAPAQADESCRVFGEHPRYSADTPTHRDAVRLQNTRLAVPNGQARGHHRHDGWRTVEPQG